MSIEPPRGKAHARKGCAAAEAWVAGMAGREPGVMFISISLPLFP